MHVVRFAIELDEVALPAIAEIGEYGAEAVQDRRVDADERTPNVVTKLRSVYVDCSICQAYN